MPALLSALLSFIAVAAGVHVATGTCTPGSSGSAELSKVLGYVTPWYLSLHADSEVVPILLLYNVKLSHA